MNKWSRSAVYHCVDLYTVPVPFVLYFTPSIFLLLLFLTYYPFFTFLNLVLSLTCLYHVIISLSVLSHWNFSVNTIRQNQVFLSLVWIIVSCEIALRLVYSAFNYRINGQLNYENTFLLCCYLLWCNLFMFFRSEIKTEIKPEMSASNH